MSLALERTEEPQSVLVDRPQSAMTREDSQQIHHEAHVEALLLLVDSFLLSEPDMIASGAEVGCLVLDATPL